MTSQNAQLISDAFRAFNESGPEAFIPFTHPEGEFTTPPELASEPDTYRGHEGVRRYWDSFFEVMDEIKVDPRTLHDWGDGVVVAEMLMTARGRATGLEVKQQATMVVTVVDEKAYRISFYPSLEEAEAEAERLGGTRPA